MQGFEYKIVPAPKRAAKVKGVKLPEERFARTLTDMVNALAQEGWEYLRADTLPVEERVGLTGRTTSFQHMLVFRRALEQTGTSQSLRATDVAHPGQAALRAPVQADTDLHDASLPQGQPLLRVLSTAEAGASGDRRAGHAAE
jgi:hypothetical protein